MERLQLWQGAPADKGLRVNVKKTKFVSFENHTRLPRRRSRTKWFRFLWIDIVEQRRVDQAVIASKNAAWLNQRKYKRIRCNRRCSRTPKVRLYGRTVRVILHGGNAGACVGRRNCNCTWLEWGYSGGNMLWSVEIGCEMRVIGQETKVIPDLNSWGWEGASLMWYVDVFQKTKEG